MTTMPSTIDPVALRSILARYLPIYRRRKPHYQEVMLQSLMAVWKGHHASLLDIGGGTGVIAEAIARLMPVARVETVDMVDRFCAGLTVRAQAYDGKRLPFADGSFDSATLNNVLHHVPPAQRVELLCEIRRTVSGPLYIKDHLQTGMIDRLRLIALDAIGNTPFGGMIAADYLGWDEWVETTQKAGWKIADQATPARYRRGLMALVFPNRLEITLRLEPA